MKIYKASLRKSGSFKFSFWLRSNLSYLTRAHTAGPLKFSFDSDANLTNLTARLAENLANLTNSRFYLNLMHAKFDDLQEAVKFELAWSRPSRLKRTQAQKFAEFDPHKFNAGPLKPLKPSQI